MPKEPLERLAKVLARAGIASRRKSEDLITEGRVYVDNKQIREPGFHVDPLYSDIRVDGERIRPEKKVVYILNKPKGLLSTCRDEQGRPTVFDLFRNHTTRLFPVGRLDKDSEGLLLITNDGILANRLTHPRYRIAKSYLVEVRGKVTRDDLARARKGVWLKEGKLSLKRVSKKRGKGPTSLLEVTLMEGKNREIRRIFARLGLKVKGLMRTAVGPLRLGTLQPGKYRQLRKKEEEELYRLALGAPEQKKAGR